MKEYKAVVPRLEAYKTMTPMEATKAYVWWWPLPRFRKDCYAVLENTTADKLDWIQIYALYRHFNL